MKTAQEIIDLTEILGYSVGVSVLYRNLNLGKEATMSRSESGILAALTSRWRWLETIRQIFARQQAKPSNVVVLELPHTILELPKIFADGQPPMQKREVHEGHVTMPELSNGVARIRYESRHIGDITTERLRVTWRGTTRVYIFSETIPTNNLFPHEPRELSQEKIEALQEFLRQVNVRVSKD